MEIILADLAVDDEGSFLPFTGAKMQEVSAKLLENKMLNSMRVLTDVIDECLPEFANFIAACESLKHIEFYCGSNRKISANAIKCMAKSKSIKQVSIASNESWDLCGTKEQANEICDALLGCAIKKLSFVVRWPWLTGPFQRLLSKTTTEEIIEQETVQEIGAGLVLSKSVKSLRIDCALAVEGLDMLFEGIAKNTTLKKLHIGLIGDSCKKLTNGTTINSQTFVKNKSLEDLRLKGFKDDVLISAIAEALPKASLTSLGLFCCSFSGDTCTKLQEGLLKNSSLTSLSYEEPPYVPIEANELMSTMTKLPLLKKLKLEVRQPIPLEDLAKNTNLKKLQLDLGLRNYQNLSSIALPPNLESFQCNPFVSAEAVAQFFESIAKCPCLRELPLIAISGDDAVREFFKNFNYFSAVVKSLELEDLSKDMLLEIATFIAGNPRVLCITIAIDCDISFYNAEEETFLVLFKALETNLTLESFELIVSEFPEDLSAKVRTHFAANYSLLNICLSQTSTVKNSSEYFTDITWRNTQLKNERRFKTAKLPPCERPENEEHTRKKQKS